MFRVVIVSVLVLVGCGTGNGPHKSVPTQSKAAGGGGTGGTPGFDTVKSIFQARCSGCHPGQQANNWLDYQQAKQNAANIKSRVWTNKSAPNQMPKAGSPESTAITEAERKTIADWADAGAPEKSSGAANAGGGAAPAPAVANAGKLQACFSCHGEGGRGNAAMAAPSLGGQNADYIYNQLVAFQTTQRQDPSGAMNAQMADKTNEEMREYANDLAKLPGFYEAKASGKPFDQKKFEVGKLVAEGCVGCHANADLAQQPNQSDIPYLAGQGRVYLLRQLARFKEGWRKNDVMTSLAAGLSTDEIEAVALYFSEIRK